ncbi:MAG: hypothetical protein EXR07_14875 [Acetobacteraceae bacterium]|nr:hypothetical protein [Acetobacteraceae bacterium]
MALATHLLIVAATVDPSVEADWNRWYNEIHLPEIRDCPGFRSGQRFVSPGLDGTRRYVAIYEVDGPEAFDTPEFNARRGWGPFTGKVTWETVRYTAAG